MGRHLTRSANDLYKAITIFASALKEAGRHAFNPTPDAAVS